MNNNVEITHKPNGSGFKRIFKAFICSMKGFKAAFLYESAFRQELLLCSIMLPFSFVIASTVNDWIMLILTLLFLLFAEIINSAIEALADRVSLEHNELLGRAKDLGSAGVFVAISALFITWLVFTYLYISK